MSFSFGKQLEDVEQRGTLKCMAKQNLYIDIYTMHAPLFPKKENTG